jgi:SAM-dependent methyltransferase
MGHQYPVVNGVPVLLDYGPQTMDLVECSLRQAQQEVESGVIDPYYIDTIGISPEEKIGLKKLLPETDNRIDPVVSFLVAATNGIAYKDLVGKLEEYPIPSLRLPPGNGQLMLDVGCNWGRWCIAAARMGYQVVGIDPSLGAILAAKRVAAQLGVTAQFVVGDARFLPFRTASIDVVFSYSVIQHFSREDAARAVQQIGRVLRPNGKSLIQMPATFGLRCLYHQARRRFREPRDFDVRYWSVPALRRLFTQAVGPTAFSVDCFFGIGLQASDVPLMPASYGAVIRASELLRAVSRIAPPLIYAADSIYVESRAETPR